MTTGKVVYLKMAVCCCCCMIAADRHFESNVGAGFGGFRHGKLKDKLEPHDHYAHVRGMYKTQGSMELALAPGSCAAEGSARSEDLLVIERVLDPLDRGQIASSTMAPNKGVAKTADSAKPHGQLKAAVNTFIDKTRLSRRPVCRVHGEGAAFVE